MELLQPQPILRNSFCYLRIRIVIKTQVFSSLRLLFYPAENVIAATGDRIYQYYNSTL